MHRLNKYNPLHSIFTVTDYIIIIIWPPGINIQYKLVLVIENLSIYVIVVFYFIFKDASLYILSAFSTGFFVMFFNSSENT